MTISELKAAYKLWQGLAEANRELDMLSEPDCDTGVYFLGQSGNQSGLSVTKEEVTHTLRVRREILRLRLKAMDIYEDPIEPDKVIAPAQPCPLRKALVTIQELATDTPFNTSNEVDAQLDQIVRECENALSGAAE